MTITFADLQDEDNPQNGMQVDNPGQIRQLLNERQSLGHPVACQFLHADGSNVVVGVGPTLGFAQYTARDALPPYLMAVAPSVPVDQQDIEFAVGDTMTPIAGKYLVPMELVVRVAEEYAFAGRRSDAVSWVEFE